MKKFSRNKIALLLACTSVLGNKASAMNMKKAQNPQSIVAVGGASNKDSNKGFVNWIKNHKWQLGIGSTLTVAAVVLSTILSVKYLKPKKEEPKKKNLKESKKEEPKEEARKEPKKEELKSKADLKKEESGQKEVPKEKGKSKTEESQEVDAVDYILDKTRQAIESHMNFVKQLAIDEEAKKLFQSNDEKVFNMIKSYFDKINKQDLMCMQNIDETLKKYFDGTSRMQSKNICFKFSYGSLFIALNFENCSCFIGISKSKLQSTVVSSKNKIDYCIKNMFMPSYDEGKSVVMIESQLLN